MYLCKEILQLYFGIILYCLVLQSACRESTEQPSCLYPPGSIVCKIYNYTNLDCEQRNLVCIPPIPVGHKASLELLDLSRNKLTILPESAFSGLRQLQTLDLSFNSISTFHEYAFAGLDSLQTLNLYINKISSIPDKAFRELDKLTHLVLAMNFINFLGDNSFIHLSSLKRLDMHYARISSLCNDTFKGLDNLRILDLRWNNLNNIPQSTFNGLVSLQKLSMHSWSVNNFVFSPVLFAGLDHLIFLNIGASKFTIDTPFHQLSSLRHLELYMDTCSFTESLFAGLQKLEFLEMRFLTVEPCAVNFSPLISLTNLTLIDLKENATFPGWKSLETLDAPLQSLSFSTTIVAEQIILNSRTFELWPKWKLNLKVFEINVAGHGMFKIEGSPFQGFPNLTNLYLRGYQQPDLTIQKVSKEAFHGLENLEHLWVQYLETNILTSGALTVFSEYNALKIVNLAENHLDDCIKLDQICNLLSLEQIDFSDSLNDDFRGFDCTLPNLSDLNIGNDKKIYLSLFDDIFKEAPNLKILNVENCEWTIYMNVTFSYLVTLQSSHSSIHICDTCNVLTPWLEELFLSEIYFLNLQITNLKILHTFEAPQLKMLDMSHNQISIIDKKDGKLLRNLKFIDLQNNQLTEIFNLPHFHDIEVLLLGSNKITAVPKPLLQTSTALRKLDFCNNVLQCDCSVEAFKKWILADEFVLLVNNYSEFLPGKNIYKCFSPDTQKGQSVTQIDLDCELHLFRYISIGIACAVFVMIIVVVVVRYRWHIQYRLFLLFNRRNFQNILNNDDIDNNDIGDENGLPRYDAYVTYHREDEDWVDGELLPNVEECQEPFRLCLRTRDIRAGRLIFNELSLHIQRSRKIVVILTPRFVEDNWCYFELNMAHHRVLEENSKVLIFILLEKIPDDKMTLLLRQLFCSALCLKWPADGYGQYLFWQRLREELKRPVPLDRRFYI